MVPGVEGSSPFTHPRHLGREPEHRFRLSSHRECFSLYDGVSPSGKARDFDSRIRWFESGHPSQFDPLAQLAEHLPFKQGVRGSNPRRVTNKKNPQTIDK